MTQEAISLQATLQNFIGKEDDTFYQILSNAVVFLGVIVKKIHFKNLKLPLPFYCYTLQMVKVPLNEPYQQKRKHFRDVVRSESFDADHWIKELKNGTIKKNERACHSFMEQMDYKKYKNLSQLWNHNLFGIIKVKIIFINMSL